MLSKKSALSVKNYKKIVSEKYINLKEEKINEFKNILNTEWILVLENFINDNSLNQMKNESDKLYSKAYKSNSSYNLFVEEEWSIAIEVLKNKNFITTKSCVCYDEILETDILKILYNNLEFKNLIKWIVWEKELFPYKDNLSSININYYDKWDSLEWHYDNSVFTVTLLIKDCEKWGEFQYFTDIRYKKNWKEDYVYIEKIVDWI